MDLIYFKKDTQTGPGQEIAVEKTDILKSPQHPFAAY